MIALAYIFCSVSAGKNEIGVCAQMLPAFVADKRFGKFSPALFYPGWVKKGLKPTQSGFFPSGVLETPFWRRIHIMAQQRQRFPEAASGVRKVLATVPVSVRGVLLKYRLQRSGCLVCGIGPHCTLQCSLVDHQRAETMEAELFKHWMALIGEQLLVFASAPSTSAYLAGADVRLAAHARANRPLRFQRRPQDASRVSPHVDTGGFRPAPAPAPDPAPASPPNPSAQGRSLGRGIGRGVARGHSGSPGDVSGRGAQLRQPAQIPQGNGSSPASRKAAQPRDDMDEDLEHIPAQALSGPRASLRPFRTSATRRAGPQHPEGDRGHTGAQGVQLGVQPPPYSAGETTGSESHTSVRAASASSASVQHQKSTATSGSVSSGADKGLAHTGVVPLSPRPPPRPPSVPPVPRTPPSISDAELPALLPTEAILADPDIFRFTDDVGDLVEVMLPPDSEWLSDATTLDGLAPFIRSDAPATVAQVVMNEALVRRLCGSRRDRGASPSATPQPNKARVHGQHVTKLYVPSRLLFPGPSSSTTAASQDTVNQPPVLDYDQWTQKTYTYASKVEMRAGFWQSASAEVKSRMTAYLQSLPPTTARVVQARENGWIPAL